MEETETNRPRSISEDTLEFMKNQEPFTGKEKELDCYKKCLDDGWDIKFEKTCPSVCGFE